MNELNLARRFNKRLFGVLVEEVDLADMPVELTRTWQVVHLAAGPDHVVLHAKLPLSGDEVPVTFSEEGGALAVWTAASGAARQLLCLAAGERPEALPLSRIAAARCR